MNDKERKNEDDNKNKMIIKNTQDSYVFRIVPSLQQKIKGCSNLTFFKMENIFA